MKETPSGFEYKWADLQPIRALVLVVIAAQLLGGIAGLLMPRFPDWFASVWYGAAIVTLPAFVAGLAVQARWKPGSLVQHSVMVRRAGLVSALLTAIAVAMVIFGYEKHVA